VVRERNSDLDIMKGLLTAGMVFAHLIEFFAAPSLALETLSVFIDLVSFSGFFFCFGFAVWLAYLDGPAARWRAALRTACKCYVAFVVSGSAFRILVDGQPPSLLGRNVLLYLVVSNMFIFSAKALGLGPSLSGGTLVLLYAVLMGAIAFLQYLHTLRQPRTLFPTKSNGSFLHQVICAQSCNAPRLKKRSRFGRLRSLGFQQAGAVSLDCTFIAKVMQAAGESVGAVA
jgi:hypothetical protein